MPKRKKLLAQQIAQEITQTAEQEKVKNFHLEEFLKTHKRTKMGMYTWKSSPLTNEEKQE